MGFAISCRSQSRAFKLEAYNWLMNDMTIWNHTDEARSALLYTEQL